MQSPTLIWVLLCGWALPLLASGRCALASEVKKVVIPFDFVSKFDDVVVKQIVPASPGEGHKDPRHSLETKVTVKEMEENDRRSREAKAKRQRDKTGKE